MRWLLLLSAAAFATPALAQHEEHGQHPPAEDPAAPAQADPHAGHAMPPPTEDRAAPAQEDPHAGHSTPAPAEERAAPAQSDPHAGHAMPPPAESADPHAGHDTGHTAVEPPMAPPPAEAFSGPEHAADLYYDGTAMAASRRALLRMHGSLPAYRVLVDRLEARVTDGRDGYALDAEAWYGGDIDKLWLKAEAEGEFGEGFEGVEAQALWSHAIDPWFDVQAGVRYDLRRGRDLGHLVLGVQGLAPYWIEVDAAAFLSDRGDVTARLEAEYDLRITQRLILQPRVELALAAQDIARERIGAGLSDGAVGMRLRYQVTQLFAPYVGVEYERSFGDTRRFRRLADEDLGGFSLVAGVRTWF